MAEMTVAEAIEELKPIWVSDRSGPDTLEVVISIEHGKQIAALIEQQAQEIAKKDRMLERATWVLDRTGSCPKTCDLMRNLCAARACWLAWLEKEAEEGQ